MNIRRIWLLVLFLAYFILIPLSHADPIVPFPLEYINPLLYLILITADYFINLGFYKLSLFFLNKSDEKIFLNILLATVVGFIIDLLLVWSADKLFLYEFYFLSLLVIIVALSLIFFVYFVIGHYLANLTSRESFIIGIIFVFINLIGYGFEILLFI